jgi:acyl-CoA synthetase (AMP-forming)/AMP-acid ligase II
VSAPPARSLPDHLADVARRAPDRPAAVVPGRGRAWRVLTYGELEARSTAVARGLAARGLGPGDRVALLVPPTLDFFVLAYGLLRSGVLPVLVDPGIGLPAVRGCLREAAPRAFLGVPRAVLAARALGWAPTAQQYVAVGARLPGGPTLADVEAAGGALRTPLPTPGPDDDAAIAFTSGSTGPPKGVVHKHRSFLTQLELVRELNDVADGDVLLATFPPFALFGPALGATTVVPRMDPTRPGSVDPRAVVHAANDFGATVMFGSPALLDTVARGAARRGSRMPTLRRVLSAGAPVPRQVQRRVLDLLAPGAEVLTPYGATEALPVTTLSSRELLGLPGSGICVGRPVPGVDVALVPVDDRPLEQVDREVGPGQVGEVVVRGLNVSERYWNRPEADRLAKTRWDGQVAHRMGDLAWRDGEGRLWFAGRKGHRVVTTTGRTLYSVPVEEVFNALPGVRRTALVGVDARPVLCVEVEPGVRPGPVLTAELLRLGAADEAAALVRAVLYHPRFPVDVRHNSKIDREALARWAAGRLA